MTSASSKPHIVFHYPILNIGGAQRVMINVASGLVNAGYRVSIVLSARVGELIEEVPKEIEVVAAHSSYKMTSTADYKPVLEAFQKLKPDVIVANNNRATLFCGRMKKKGQINVPVIMWSHSPVSMESAVPIWKPVHWLPQLYRKYAIYADAAVMLSQAMKQDFKNVIPALNGKYKVIYNPVLPENLAELRAQPSSHPWLTQKSTPVIISVGRLTHEKDQANLISAFAKVRETSNARLILFGEGPSRPELEAQLKASGLLDIVSLPGSVRNPFAEMAKADLFVLSSKYEGLPGALVEAIACGLPVVSTNPPYSGVSEILLEGKLGKMVPTQNSEALAAAIVETLDNPEPIEQSSMKRFTESETIASWDQLIKDLLSR